MVSVNQIGKFKNFMAAQQLQAQGSDPYELDLQKSVAEAGHLHAEDGTMASDCGCISTMITGCGTCQFTF